MWGKQVLSLALVFLVATNVEIIPGILPWLGFHPAPVRSALLVSVILPLTGIFLSGDRSAIVEKSSTNESQNVP